MRVTLALSFFAPLVLPNLCNAAPLPQDENNCITLPVIYNSIAESFYLNLVHPNSPTLDGLPIHMSLPDPGAPLDSRYPLLVHYPNSIASKSRREFAPTTKPVKLTLVNNSVYQEGIESPAQTAPASLRDGLKSIYFQEFGLIDEKEGGFAVAYGCADNGRARHVLWVDENASRFCVKNVGKEVGSGEEEWAVLIKTKSYDPALDGTCDDVQLTLVYEE